MPQRIPLFRSPRLRPAASGELRPNAAARGYCDAKHQAWRQAVLVRDAYVCRSCRRVCGLKGEAHADHASPVIAGSDRCEDGRSRYDVAAGQCLCASCHQRKTNAEMNHARRRSKVGS